MQNLYRIPIQEEIANAIKEARSQAERLDQKEIVRFSEDPSLYTKKNMQFANLKSKDRRGKRIGGEITVTVPFEGFPKTFLIRPSNYSALKVHAWYDSDGLKANFPDDSFLDDNVNIFIADVESNTENLKSDWEYMLTEARDAFNATALARKKVFEAQRLRDSKRTFPID